MPDKPQNRNGHDSSAMNKLRRAMDHVHNLAKREAATRQTILGSSAEFQGTVDRIDFDFVSGWAWDSRHPNIAVSVELFDESGYLGSALADEFRSDLKSAGKGDGRHAFRLPTPEALKDGQMHIVNVRFAGTETSLKETPIRVRLVDPAGPQEARR
jgi:hypothetical protein